MMGFLRTILGWLTGGVLDRILSTVDKKIENEANRDIIKGELIKAHLRTRAGFMRAGGFVLMLLFAVPLAFWFASVLVYSVLWCERCAYPQTWIIAALPPPLDEWAGWIIMSIFGVIGLNRFGK